MPMAKPTRDLYVTRYNNKRVTQVPTLALIKLVRRRKQPRRRGLWAWLKRRLLV